jgi:hypothetical protein
MADIDAACDSRLRIDWGRDTLYQCMEDDGPCDISRCRKYPDDEGKEENEDSKQADTGRNLRRPNDVVR